MLNSRSFQIRSLSNLQLGINDLARVELERRRRERLKEACLISSSLSNFIKEAWHVVEPGTNYVHGWHIDAICDHLEAVSNGKIRNLLINMPPRHAKSLIVSVFWPCWEWTRNPHIKWLYSSYAASLSTRDSLKCRRLIQSPWYQSYFGHVFKLTSDQNVKTRYDNDKMGYRIATSVGGSTTGEGGDRIIVDDPHNVVDSNSQVMLENAKMWWDEAMSTRGNDPKTCAKVIVMQRVNQSDLSGHVLEQGGYEHLCLPAEYEERKRVTSIGWSDPRTQEGELLWPERFGKPEMEGLKRVLGTVAAAGQLQQRPAPRGGAIIKMETFRYYDLSTAPNFSHIIQSWDTAFKKGQSNDYSVCTTWGLSDKGFYLLHRWKNKVDFPELTKAAVDLYEAYKPILVLIEDKASGQSLIQALKKTKTPSSRLLPVKPIKVDIDKESRAHAITPSFEAGLVFFPKDQEWLKDYTETLTLFPSGAHDDDVDSTTQAISYMSFLRPTQTKTILADVFSR